MATVIPFVIRRNTFVRGRSDAGSASIIIFPGVRYERPPADERPRPAPRKRKGKSR